MIWNVRPAPWSTHNDVRYGRDGIFVNDQQEEQDFDGNRFRDLRFAVHYMYAPRLRASVTGNRSEGNHVGYADHVLQTPDR